MQSVLINQCFILGLHRSLSFESHDLCVDLCGSNRGHDTVERCTTKKRQGLRGFDGPESGCTTTSRWLPAGVPTLRRRLQLDLSCFWYQVSGIKHRDMPRRHATSPGFSSHYGISRKAMILPANSFLAWVYTTAAGRALCCFLGIITLLVCAQTNKAVLGYGATISPSVASRFRSTHTCRCRTPPACRPAPPRRAALRRHG